MSVKKRFYYLFWIAITLIILISGSCASPTLQDNPPHVKILSPENGSVITGETLIKIEASDDIGISRVILYINDEKVVETTVSSLEYKWDTRTATKLANVIKAVAYDKSNQASSDICTVSVIVFSENTKVLDQETIQDFAEEIYLDVQDTNTVVLELPKEGPFVDIQIGQILFSEPNEVFPYGFMGKVKSVEVSRSKGTEKLIVSTEPAALTEVFKFASLQVSKNLIELFDKDFEYVDENGNVLFRVVEVPVSDEQEVFPKSKGQITHMLLFSLKSIFNPDGNLNFTVGGSIALTITFKYDIVIEMFNLKYAKISLETAYAKDIYLYGNINLKEKKELPIASLPPVMIGVVAITPALSFKVEASLKFTGALRYQDVKKYEIGVEYDGKKWSEIKMSDEKSSGMSLEGIGETSISIGPELKAKLYGLLDTLYAGITGNVWFGSKLPKEDQWWTLYVGWRAYAGLDLSIINKIFKERFEVSLERRDLLLSAPSVKIVRPAPESTVFGNVDMEVSATAPQGIDRVEFYVNNNKIGEKNTPPYTYTWDTTKFNNGLYEITVKAIERLARTSTEKTVRVNVKNNKPPNQPSNPNPADGAINVSTNTTLSWACSDPDGDSLVYDIYFGTDTTPPLVRSNHTSTSYNPGTLNYSTTYYWKVVAKDGRGGVTEGPV
ncbi:MAG: Ig-like domain-containing protein, partial [candidate division WOR-3 bacterium]